MSLLRVPLFPLASLHPGSPGCVQLQGGILSGETGGPEEQGEPGWAEGGATEALGKHSAGGTAEGPALSAVHARPVHAPTRRGRLPKFCTPGVSRLNRL